MTIKTLMITMSLALPFLALPQAAHAQKDGEAQAVIFDADDRPTLIFTNKSPKKQGCSARVSYTLIDDQEEAIVARVHHLHVGSLGMKPSLPESGWLYITQTRVVFRIDVGDKSHAFDLQRTELKDDAATSLGNRFQMSDYVGIRINLKEKLQPSDSNTQKFVFALVGDRGCDDIINSDPYTRFIKRAFTDFNETVTEFKRLGDALKQAGRVGSADILKQ